MALKQREDLFPPVELASNPPAVPCDATPRSPAQQAASRANAKRSTGPRTKAGKAAARMNAAKHGCYSNEFTGYIAHAYALLENGELFDPHLKQVRDDLRRKYRPGDPEESQIVDRLAMLWHRLWRLQYSAQSAVRFADDEKVHMFDAFIEGEKLQPLEARLECSIQRQRKALAFLQRMRLGHEPRWGCADFTPEEEAALAKAERSDRRMERVKPEAKTGEAATVNSSLPSNPYLAPEEPFMEYAHPLGDGEKYGPARLAETAWYPPAEKPGWGPGSGRDGEWTLADRFCKVREARQALAGHPRLVSEIYPPLSDTCRGVPERWPSVVEARRALAEHLAAASRGYHENEGTKPSPESEVLPEAGPDEAA